MGRRYMVYGAGAVGGAIGGRLHQHGHDVVLIARGEHARRCREEGLLLRSADGEARLQVETVEHPDEVAFRADDVVILAMKTQHTADALDALRKRVADVPVVCAQNGVENERLAARRFERVYGMLVAMPATFLEPGQVENECLPISGVLDAGR